MNYLTAVQHAQRVYVNHLAYGREALVNEAVALGEWGVWSKRQVAAFTGLRPALVNDLITKKDRTGGKFNPAALPAVVAVCRMVARDEMDATLISAALRSGCSSVMLSRLTGAPQSTLSRWGRKA